MAGRPRKHAPEAGATQRMRASREAFAARGGRVAQVRLEPEEAAALDRLKAAHNLPSDRDAISLAIMQAARRLPSL